MSRRTLSTTLLAGLVAGGLAACGSSKAPGVSTAPGGGATQASVTAATTTTSSSSTTSVATPKPPSPLSQKPVVVVPKGAAPKTLIIKDLIKGTGAVATTGKTVTVNYVGVLYSNGKEFDSSWKRNQTFPFALGQGQVIAGWDKGVAGMRVGGRRELIIPPSLAYKNQAQQGIPANSTLVFVVDLLAVS